MAIIGISGKSKSGKNTVATIMQCLSYGLSDYQIISILENKTVNPEDKSIWTQRSFAEKLKQIVSIVSGISVDNLNKEEYKASSLGEKWGYITVREMLQIVGTDCFRGMIHKDTWVNALMEEYRFPKLSEYNPSYWIITDVRFRNECEAIKDRYGILVRVNRNLDKYSSHLSETELDDFNFDYTIDNSGDIFHLVGEVRKISHIL